MYRHIFMMIKSQDSL